jgi:hypothetical protein
MSEEQTNAPTTPPRPNTPKLHYDATKSEAAMNRITDRLSVWLLAGNAGGLLLCFNAALDHKICDWDSFRVIALEFGGGAAAILLAHVMTAFSYSWRGGIEGYKAVNADVSESQASVHGCMMSIFAVVLQLAMGATVLLFLVGFVTLIHAPLSFLLDANASHMLCAGDLGRER